MPRLTETMFFTALVLTLGVGTQAFAQDYDYSPHERYSDALNQPYELEGFALGREAPFISTEDLGPNGPPPGKSFEIEAPPMGTNFLVFPAGQ